MIFYLSKITELSYSVGSMQLLTDSPLLNMDGCAISGDRYSRVNHQNTNVDSVRWYPTLVGGVFIA